MLSKSHLGIFCFYLMLSNISYVLADEAPVESWSPNSAGPVTTWTAPLCGRRKFIVQPFFFFNHTRGTFDSEGHYDSLPSGNKKYQYQEQIFAQYGLLDRLELDGQAVYQHNYLRQQDLSAHSDGFGDSALFLRYCALEETKHLPHVTGLLQLKLPTGKFQKADPDKLGMDLMGAGSGGGSYDHGYGINLTKKIKPFILHADMIYSVPIETKVDGVETQYGTYLNHDFGVELILPKGFNFMFEFNGFCQRDKKENGARIPSSDVSTLNFSQGIGWSNETIQVLLAYQRTLRGTNTDANDSLVGTFVYTF